MYKRCLVAMGIVLSILPGCGIKTSYSTMKAGDEIVTLGITPDFNYEKTEQKPGIIIDCEGYLPTGKKMVYLLAEEVNRRFYVVNMDNEERVYESSLSKLEDTTFFFDLDADGKEDKISHLNSGSGFLALDKNNDGSINDGSELFGAKSGNGFSELSAFDTDNNGWIDENDEIFDKLKIWVKTASGENVLYSLKDKNVGAIFLGNVNTGHTLRGNDGSTRGMLRNSGFFLYEDGSGVGTVSHIDMATG